MHIISICYASGTAQDFLYEDAESAKENFQKLQTAMAQYRQFKNDNAETVYLSSRIGESIFRVEHLVSVAMSNAADVEPIQIEYAEWSGRLLAIRKAAGSLPLTSRDGK